MSEQQFKQSAETGDLLLFRGNRMATGITRALTFSEFDHVGIIIRADGIPDDVHIIEATGGPGVCYNRWNNLRKHVGKEKFY
jgi:hypothetical protein